MSRKDFWNAFPGFFFLMAAARGVAWRGTTALARRHSSVALQTCACALWRFFLLATSLVAKRRDEAAKKGPWALWATIKHKMIYIRWYLLNALLHQRVPHIYFVPDRVGPAEFKFPWKRSNYLQLRCAIFSWKFVLKFRMIKPISSILLHGLTICSTST